MHPVAVLWSIALVLLPACHGLFHPTDYLKGKGDPPRTSVAEAWKAFQPSANHDEIVAASPDIWQTIPKELDQETRNPCWKNSTGHLKCMPFFQILGVSKCGTTDIYGRLSRHPDVAAAVKGPHWWDECVYPPRGPCTAVPSGDFAGYVNAYRRAALMIKDHPVAVTGEASSNTFTGVYTYVRGIAAARGINITLAQLMREAQPYIRMIVVFRDPVTRYQSAFHYYSHLKDPKAPYEGPKSFHAKVKYDINKWQNCVAQHGKFACLKGYSPPQLIKSMYAEFVEAWTSQFPKEQFLFVRNEDYTRTQRDHLEVIFRFLGLRSLTEPEWKVLLGEERFNTQRYPEMFPETRKLLQDFYKPFNDKLAELMDDPRFTWSDYYQADGK